MKTRIGFVSNSSSSSFIVTDNITTAELARSMIDIIEADYLDYPGEKHSKWYQSAVKWLDEHLEFDGPIVIPWSCNYDTFLIPKDRNILVDTCNNHPWWDLPFDTAGSQEGFECTLEGMQEIVFLDLTTFEPVKYSDYLDLWEREHGKL